MTRFPLIVALALAVPGCGSTTIGSGISATEVRAATGATALDARMWLDTTVRIGSASEVAVTCDDNLLDEIITEVVDGALVIRERLDLGSVTTNVPCDAVVELPAYERILNGGAGNMTLEGDFAALPDLRATGSGPITGDGAITDLEVLLVGGSGGVELAQVDTSDLEVRQPGSGNIRIDALDAVSVDVDNGSSGSTQLAGSADSAIIDVSGSGRFLDKDFVAVEADLVLSGSGTIELTVAERVSVVLSGSGDVTVYGDPEDRTIDDTGTGSVTFPQ
jgi:hypothetical protein